MLDDASGNSPGTDPGTRGQGTWGEDPFAVVIDFPSGEGSDGDGGDRGLINAGLEANDDPDSTGNDRFSVAFGDIFDDDDDGLPDGDAGEHALSFSTSCEEFAELDVDLSPWAPLLGMLDSTEPEEWPGDRPFTPGEGVKQAHALELRAESMLQYAERGAQRTGELDRTEVGLSDDNRDVVAGRDEVEIDGMLEEHTGHGLVHVADDVVMNVGGSLRMHAHLEDNIIMGGVMRDEWSGGTLITAAMSDDMAAGLGIRCTAPLDVWVHGLVGMEERPGTCAADGILFELAGTLYEREYGPSVHSALVARLQGTVATTMKTGFRPLMKTALGVRNLIPGGGGGGGDASASPPAAPPAPGGGETASAVTLTAAGTGGALGRGVAGGGDTDDIVSAARVADSASETAEVENLRHPANTAENVDNLARIDVEGTGYQQVADIYDQPVTPSAVSEPDGGGSVHSRLGTVDGPEIGEGALVEPHRLEGNPELNAWVDGGGDADEVAHHSVAGGEGRVDPDIGDPGGASAPATDAQTPLASRRPPEDSTPTSNPGLPDSVFATPRPAALDLTEPGTEGYDFGKSYDLLRNRQQHYRDHAMWRGNLGLTEAIEAIDKRAIELFTGFDGSIDDIAADASTRTPSIREALEAMADQAETAGDAQRLGAIRDAIDELDELVHGAAIDLAARADEFSGAALGAQRVPIDSHIDTDMLRGWLDEQLTNTNDKLSEAYNLADPDALMLAVQRAGWEQLYYTQMIQSLDKDISPLATSSEMIAYLRTKGSMAQIELMMQLEAGLVATLSDPSVHPEHRGDGCRHLHPVRARAHRRGARLPRTRFAAAAWRRRDPAAPPCPEPLRQRQLPRRSARSQLPAKRARSERGDARAARARLLRAEHSGAEPHVVCRRRFRVRRDPGDLPRQPPRGTRQRPGSDHRRAVGPVGRRVVRGARHHADDVGQRIAPRAPRRHIVADLPGPLGFGAAGAGRLRGRSRRRRRRRRRRGADHRFVQAGAGTQRRERGRRRGAPRPRRERRRLRLAGLRRHGRRRCEPDRDRLRADRFHHHHLGRGHRDRARFFRHLPGHARTGCNRHRHPRGPRSNPRFRP